MKLLQRVAFVTILIFCHTNIQSAPYPWLQRPMHSSVHDITVPAGFMRVQSDSGTFEDWLRYLPLKEGDNRVYLYDGRVKTNQDAHYRIIDIDIGNEDLQHCADAVIRLKAEYLYNKKNFKQIAFHFTSGDYAGFWKWAQGYRPIVNGNNVRWERIADTTVDVSYDNFRAYLDIVFMYAGTYSLEKELAPVNELDRIRIGDLFIKGGFPGHVVIVVDMAVDTITNQTGILLAQSYMPAQEIHILKNPNNQTCSPWYIVGEGDLLKTPEFTFEWTDLKRFVIE